MQKLTVTRIRLHVRLKNASSFWSLFSFYVALGWAEIVSYFLNTPVVVYFGWHIVKVFNREMNRLNMYEA